MKKITDPTFKYHPSSKHTPEWFHRRMMARIRLAERQRRQAKAATVTPIKRKAP